MKGNKDSMDGIEIKTMPADDSEKFLNKGEEIEKILERYNRINRRLCFQVGNSQACL